MKTVIIMELLIVKKFLEILLERTCFLILPTTSIGDLLIQSPKLYMNHLPTSKIGQKLERSAITLRILPQAIRILAILVIFSLQLRQTIMISFFGEAN